METHDWTHDCRSYLVRGWFMSLVVHVSTSLKVPRVWNHDVASELVASITFMIIKSMVYWLA
jgi:hypothetical protein